jgi:Protein kinase domain
MHLPSGTQLGPYRIEALLGAGGMGEVYRATDTRLKRNVAVKILSSRLITEPGSKQRFEREAHTASAINDPHICTIYDVGEHEGQQFLVMELLEGQTLKQYELAGVGANRRNSASCDETGRITFSFFIHLSFAFCRHSSRLVLRFYDSPFQSDSVVLFMRIFLCERRVHSSLSSTSRDRPTTLLPATIHSRLPAQCAPSTVE